MIELISSTLSQLLVGFCLIFLWSRYGPPLSFRIETVSIRTFDVEKGLPMMGRDKNGGDPLSASLQAGMNVVQSLLTPSSPARGEKKFS